MPVCPEKDNSHEQFDGIPQGLDLSNMPRQRTFASNSAVRVPWTTWWTKKLFNFLAAAEQDPAFAAEMPTFIAEIRRLFTAQELRDYLDHLARSKYFAEAEREPDDLVGVDDETMEEPWPDHPVLGAQELLRFFRVRELLQQ